MIAVALTHMSIGRPILAALFLPLLLGYAALAQPATQPRVRTVTIPISIFTKRELRENQAEEFVQADRLIVRENNAEQQILSIRSVSASPLSIAIVVQEDLATNFNLQIKELKDFIRGLPRGTRVMVAYTRAGSAQIRQRFTDDLETAAESLRIVAASGTLAPRSPYDGLDEILNRFQGVPTGRRAVLLFSDGVDTSEGLNLASISQSADLERAILRAQRSGVSVYSFYAPTTITHNGNSALALAGQGALHKLADETGGRAFSSGTIAPLSYIPYFRDLVLSLNRQFALTYLSTHMRKGYYKVAVESTNPEVKIEHPRGYYYR
jgi:VWFA-related protein